MALPNSGPIAFNMLNLQLHRPEMQQISLHDVQVRGLAGKTSGPIGLDDLRGKYAGAKLTAAYIGSDMYGFQAPPASVGEVAAGELVGVFGGVPMRKVVWRRISSSDYQIYLYTVIGADQPTATKIVVRGPNFEPILHHTLDTWFLSNGSWVASTGIMSGPNPFPAGSTRWIS